ncbi:hypothetical protein HHL19_16355 [Streptomyces sp. R302]|uniref:hypothetical protein n=1 Tax=unclassified Streptomyces TaxID=2593676 RepID=UPI00145F0AE1|nr:MULTISPECIES: hypothetical protein [unclassified Streptomyces]NML55343.1 hypothetical protein [Streptomyces sp. R301]NML80215.1 hypothetical protein [Streptomyces sp. R302]
MDTTALDAAARRYRRAEAALDRARAELITEVVAVLEGNEERGAQADVARRTGWSREQIRQIMQRNAETKRAESASTE